MRKSVPDLVFPAASWLSLGLLVVAGCGVGCSARGADSSGPSLQGKSDVWAEGGGLPGSELKGEAAAALLAQAFLALSCPEGDPPRACPGGATDLDEPPPRWAGAGFALTLWAAAAGTLEEVGADGLSFAWPEEVVAAAEHTADPIPVDFGSGQERDPVAAWEEGRAVEIGWMRFANATRHLSRGIEPPSPSVMLAAFDPVGHDPAGLELTGRDVVLSMEDGHGRRLRAHLRVWQVPLGEGLSASIVHPEDLRLEWSDPEPTVQLARGPGATAAGQALNTEFQSLLNKMFRNMFPKSASAKRHREVRAHGDYIDTMARSKNPAYKAWAQQQLNKLRAATGEESAAKLAKDSAVMRSVIKSPPGAKKK